MGAQHVENFYCRKTFFVYVDYVFEFKIPIQVRFPPPSVIQMLFFLAGLHFFTPSSDDHHAPTAIFRQREAENGCHCQPTIG